LKKTYGPKGDDVTGGWRRLHARRFIVYSLYPRFIKTVDEMEDAVRMGVEKDIII
jgi:hypothetical protein